MNLGLLCHIRSKYKGFIIVPHVESGGVDVFRKDGEHMLCVRNGVCLSEKVGASHRLCLEPIARETRLFKAVVNSKGVECIVKDDQYDSRIESRKNHISEDGHVLSEIQSKKLAEEKAKAAQPAA